MRIYNSDGSEPEMCGNGIRCLAKFVADIDGVEAARHRVDTLGGLHAATGAFAEAIQRGSSICTCRAHAAGSSAGWAGVRGHGASHSGA